jgi:hypothetical protein
MIPAASLCLLADSRMRATEATATVTIQRCTTVTR